MLLKKNDVAQGASGPADSLRLADWLDGKSANLADGFQRAPAGGVRASNFAHAHAAVVTEPPGSAARLVAGCSLRG